MSKESGETIINSQITKMSPTDIDEVITMGLNTPEFQTGTEAAQFYSKETLERWVGHEDGVTIVSRVEKKLAGFFLGYYMEGPNDGYMNCIAVASEYRNQGIGGQLLESALSEFEQKGVGNIRCDHVFGVTEEDNMETLQFLEKHGLQKGKKFYYVETMLPRQAK